MHIIDPSSPGPGHGQHHAYANANAGMSNNNNNRKNSLSYPKSPKASSAHASLNGHGHGYGHEGASSSSSSSSSAPLARKVSGPNYSGPANSHPVAPNPRRSPSTSSVEVIQGRRPGEIFMPEGIVDMSSFGQILAMDENDPTREFSKALVWAWCDQAEMAVEEMQHFIDEGRIVPVADKAHYLKGSSSSLGLSKVSQTCQSIYHVHFPPSLAHLRAFSYNIAGSPGANGAGGSGNPSSSSSGSSSSSSSGYGSGGGSSARFSERSSASSAASSAPSSVAASPYSSYHVNKDIAFERRGSLPSSETSSTTSASQHGSNAAASSASQEDETAQQVAASSHTNHPHHSPPIAMTPANMNAQQANPFHFAIKSMSPRPSNNFSSSSSSASGRSSADIYSPHMYAKDCPHQSFANKDGNNGQADGPVDPAAHFEREKLRRAQELLERLKYEIREGSEWLYTYYQESDRYAGVAPSTHSA